MKFNNSCPSLGVVKTTKNTLFFSKFIKMNPRLFLPVDNLLILLLYGLESYVYRVTGA